MYIFGRLQDSWCLSCGISGDRFNEAHAGAHCILCNFRYQNSHGVPDYSYTSDVSPRHVSSTRRLGCSAFLESHKLSAPDASFLGIKEGNTLFSHEIGTRPLFDLAMELKAERIDLKNNKGG